MSDNQYITYYCYPRMYGLKSSVLKAASSQMNAGTRPNMGPEACIQLYGENASERVVTIGAGFGYTHPSDHPLYIREISITETFTDI